MAVNDIYESIVSFTLDDRDISVSLYNIETVARTGTPQEVAAALNVEIKIEFWTAYLKPLLSSDLKYTGVKTQMVSPTREAPDVVTESTPDPGTLVSDALNGTNAVVVAEYGAEWGPRTRGRMFVPGLPESQVASGRIETADFGPFQTAADNYYTSVFGPLSGPGGTYVPCVFSPAKPNAVPPLPAVSSHPVTAVVRPRIGTQRRRRTNVRTPS